MKFAPRRNSSEWLPSGYDNWKIEPPEDKREEEEENDDDYQRAKDRDIMRDD